MAAPGASKVRATGAELNQLIAEVGAWLRGGGDSSMDGSGATQADAHAAQFVAKLRAILPRLLDALLDPERGACGSHKRAPPFAAFGSCAPLTRRGRRAVRERGSKELKPIVGLVAVALAKHPAVFGNGRGAFPMRVFCRVLALLPLPMRRVPASAGVAPRPWLRRRRARVAGAALTSRVRRAALMRVRCSATRSPASRR
jgi:hypothetical protein